MRPGPKYKAEERIIELRRSGLTVADVAEQAGVSQSTVVNCLKRQGMSGQRVATRRPAPAKKPAGKSGLQPKYDEQIIALRREGLTVRRISERLDISQKTVCDGLKRHGLAKAQQRKRKAPANMDMAFTLMVIGDRVGIKVLPTSEAQYERLLAALRELGGEVI
jgi:IS30 family transposase